MCHGLVFLNVPVCILPVYTPKLSAWVSMALPQPILFKHQKVKEQNLRFISQFREAAACAIFLIFEGGSVYWLKWEKHQACYYPVAPNQFLQLLSLLIRCFVPHPKEFKLKNFSAMTMVFSKHHQCVENY